METPVCWSNLSDGLQKDVKQQFSLVKNSPGTLPHTPSPADFSLITNFVLSLLIIFANGSVRNGSCDETTQIVACNMERNATRLWE